MNSNTKRDVIVFSGLLVYLTLLSVCLQTEFLYDLANYHYYNAWAFLNNRMAFDIIPGANNTFFNPLLDIPLYFYIKYFNDNSLLIYSLQGIWGAIFCFLFYKIYGLFFNIQTKKDYIIFSLSIILVSTGNAFYCQIGTSTNEVAVSCFMLGGIYILLKTFKFPEMKSLYCFMIAGLIMGIGLGLKQTAITYCISSGMSLIICYKYLSRPLKSISLFALGGLMGYLLVHGYFMYKYWTLYGNPMAPFLNNIFRSPYFYEFNMQDKRFLPSLKTFFIYPFLWNIKPFSIAEEAYYDIRLTLCYIICLFEFARLIVIKSLRSNSLSCWVFLEIFLLSSFFIWMTIFSNMRYSIPIEALTILYLVRLGIFMYNSNKIIYDFIGVWLFIMLTGYIFFANSWGKISTKEHVYVEKVLLPENSILEIFGIPSAFIIPEFAKYSPKFRALTHYQHQKGASGIKVEWWNFIENTKFAKERDEIEKKHNGPVVIVYSGYKDKMNDLDLKYEIGDIVKLCENAKKQKFLSEDMDCYDSQYSYYDPSAIKLFSIIKQDYFCRKLRNNLNPDLQICVPLEMKNQILGEEYE